jgi:hypothetical protein
MQLQTFGNKRCILRSVFFGQIGLELILITKEATAFMKSRWISRSNTVFKISRFVLDVKKKINFAL